MTYIFSNLISRSFNIKHAALLSMAVHALLLSTHPFDLSKKTAIQNKNYKKVRLEIIQKPVIIKKPEAIKTQQKKVVKKPLIKNTTPAPKPLVIPANSPTKKIDYKPRLFTPNAQPIIKTPSLVIEPSPPIQPKQKVHLLNKAINTRVSPKIIDTTFKSSVPNQTRISKFINSEINSQIGIKNIQPKVITRKKSGYSGLSNERSNLISTKTEIDRTLNIEPRKVVLKAAKQDEISSQDFERVWTKYTNEIRKKIAETKDYPSEAREKGQEGKIYLSFKLGRKGEVLQLLIDRSSGNNILDDAARKAVSNAQPFPPIPKKLNKKYASFKIPVSFILR